MQRQGVHLVFEDADKGVNAVDLTSTGDDGAHTLRTSIMVDLFGLANETKYPGDIGAGILLDLFRIARDEDQRPWLRLIDGDMVWRANTLSMTRSPLATWARSSKAADTGAKTRSCISWRSVQRRPAGPFQ